MIIERDSLIIWDDSMGEIDYFESGWEELAKELSEAFDKRDREHFMITLSRLVPNVYVPPISPS